MLGTGIFVIFGVVIVVFIAIAVFGVIAAKKRREAFQAYAAAKGWTWTAKDNRWVDAFNGAPFGLGHGREAGNVLTGAYASRNFAAFDYCYRTTETTTDAEGHTSTHDETHSFTVAAIDAGTRFPNLAVAPEGFFTRAIGKLTNHDIQLESEEFNRAFTVHCEDRKFASDVLHPRMMEFLLAHRDLGWRFDGTWILTVDNGARSPEQVEQVLATISSILDTVPDFVWQDHGGRAG